MYVENYRIPRTEKKRGGGGVFEYTGFAWDLIISLHYKQINT